MSQPPRLLSRYVIYVAFGLYLYLLARLDLSQAFPTAIAVNILLVAVMASVYLLGEICNGFSRRRHGNDSDGHLSPGPLMAGYSCGFRATKFMIEPLPDNHAIVSNGRTARMIREKIGVLPYRIVGRQPVAMRRF